MSRTLSAPPPARQATARGLLRDGLAVLSLWALVIALYWRIALAGRVLAGGDAYLYFYPYWAEASRALRAGRLPLWNPYLFMGAPFLANSQVGLFYPLNWPLWLALPTHIAIHASIVVHLCLAAWTAYAWARSALRLERPWAGVAAATYALGGYLGAQVEHVNQLQGLAWLPLALLLAERAAGGRRRAAPTVGLAFVVALILLAGHTQVALITMVGVIVGAIGPPLWRGVVELRRRGGTVPNRGRRRTLVRHILGQIGPVVVALGLGVLLAGVQLLPTLELTRQSIRAGGLPFEERVSFSLSPLYLARALLPTIMHAPPPAHMEHIAYVGLAGLGLAVVAVWRRARGESPARPNHQPALILAAAGLFLALGGYNPLYLALARFVPGFAHFRVPARWLALYALGVAGLVGCGGRALWRLEWAEARATRRAAWLVAGLLAAVGWAIQGPRLSEGASVGWGTILGWLGALFVAAGALFAARRLPRLATTALLATLGLELCIAGQSLPAARATAPQAYTGLRPAVAHLKATARAEDRFLSMSDITFDPGDLAEIRVIYGPQLPADALYDIIISAKLREVLSPNLSLAYGLAAVDGYDGGILPLARYVALQRLFLPEERVSLDGRLRENLAALPAGRWLNLFRVRAIITDKLRDAWLDDVFYDLQFGARLGDGERVSIADVPPFEATALGLVSYLDGASGLSDGTPVGSVEITFDDGSIHTFILRAGEHTAEGRYDETVAHRLAPVGGHFWPGEPDGNDYAVRLRWGRPSLPTAVEVRASLPQGVLVVRGLSLVDERTGGFQALTVCKENRLRLAHSGDVKIYENADALPWAFVVHRAALASSPDEALEWMRAPSFDPAEEVVLEGTSNRALEGATGGDTDAARIVSSAPERLEIEVTAASSGYLVVTDAWYPGWRAVVDGNPTPILPADLLFRAVPIPAGTHQVVMSYRPASLHWGAVISLVGVLGTVLLGLLLHRCPAAALML